jgi:hypothetical protein
MLKLVENSLAFTALHNTTIIIVLALTLVALHLVEAGAGAVFYASLAV